MTGTGNNDWSRRRFLAAASCAPLSADLCLLAADAQAAMINTVQGKVPAKALGVTLMHEHVLVDFIGADQVRRDRYNAEEVIRVVLPHLRRIRELGCRTLVECTPAYLGRDPLLLRRLAEASGIRLITNTGYYGAGGGKYLPRDAREQSAEWIAERWIAEFRHGIEDTGIKPGFIKIGVNNGPLNPIDAKLVRAAALAHRETGLTIACHTGDGAAAIEETEILKQEGVAPSALIWVHAQNGEPEILGRLARAGVWIEFDGVDDKALSRRVEQVKSLQLIGRVLTSLDAGWFHVGEPGGGSFRSYEYYFTTFLPALRKAGVAEAGIRQMTVEGPSLALQPLVR
jgi:phosphotriesterase-related protein